MCFKHSSKMASEINKALSPAQRAADWILSQMESDGSLRGASSINEYYKTVFALAVAGRVAEADRMLEYVAGRFLMDDGDLDGTGCPWFEQFRIYCHPWIAMAATVRARFDIAERILRFLDAWHDDKTGGFYGTTEQRQKRAEQEMMTTGIIAIAMLWAGRTEIAKRTAVWMKNVWDAQLNLERGLCFVWHRDKGLVTNFPPDAVKSYMVDVTALAQKYYQYGIPAAFLSSFASVTQEQSWLELARDYLHASRHCREDVYRRPQSGKLGWGAAWTYRLTRDPKDREIADKVHAGLAAVQHAEGWWPTQNVYGGETPATVTPGLDLTGEFLAHLSWIESILGSPAA